MVVTQPALDRSMEELQALMEMLGEEWKRQAGGCDVAVWTRGQQLLLLKSATLC